MPAARVVPGVPSFSVDDGFLYEVPETMDLSVGSLVRIPLGGRRTRGYVVGFEETDSTRLKPVAGVSGDLPVFDEDLLSVLRWVSHHYVAPLSVVLERAAPPNNPVTDSNENRVEPAGEGVNTPLALIQRWGVGDWVAGVENTVRSGRSAVVIVATVTEARSVEERVRTETGAKVHLVTGDTPDADATRTWCEMATVGGVLVGTPRVALWRVANPGSIVVIEEARRAMKERQTPTIHVRELALQRAAVEGWRPVFVGPTPSPEVVSVGADLKTAPGRVWSRVDLVDRGDEPPGGSLITDTVIRIIRGVIGHGGKVAVFTHRRGFSAATRCVSCGELRRCPRCGTRPGPGERCERCGEPLGACVACSGERFEPLGAGVGRVTAELRRTFGDEVGEGPIWVVTERDLPDLEPLDLAVAVDVDGLLYAPHFRAAEEALRIMVRLAGRLRPGQGVRLVVQTASPDHPVLSALVEGSPTDFLAKELEERAAGGYPPHGDLIVIEARGERAAYDTVDADLREIETNAMTMGPAVGEGGARWLIQGNDLAPLREALRPVVQKWRDGGAVIRVDVDPIDL